MSVEEKLRWLEINRRRKRFFADDPLLVYKTTPEAGETVAETFSIDWFGHRISPTTTGDNVKPGAWQFQIRATDDWETSQVFMLAIVVLTIGNRRWKVNKVEKPIGTSMVWKVKGEIQ